MNAVANATRNTTLNQEAPIATERDLVGRNFTRVLRRSKRKQTYSIDRQRDVCHSIEEMYKLNVVEELVMDDHSATAGEQWAQLYQLIEKKKRGAKSDGILCADYSRLARTMDEAERYYLECADVGLVILTQKEGLLSGKDAWVKRNAAAAANERFGENLGVATNSGVMSLLKAGIVPHSQLIPYAIDRLTTDMAGKPLYRLRRIGNKTVLKLSPAPPHEVLDTFEGETRNDFPRRQRNERGTLVIGNPAEIEVVRRIFNWYFVGDEKGKALSSPAIAKRLRADGTPGRRNISWNHKGVSKVLSNPIYTGIGISCKIGRAVHSLRHKDNPRLFGAPRRPEKSKSGSRRKTVKSINRPVEDWYVVKYPQLMSILPPRIRRLARNRNRALQGRSGLPVGQRAKANRWDESPYFLTGLLRVEHGNRRMWGLTSRYGEERKSYRSYTIPTDDRPEIVRQPAYKKTVNADLVEQCFIDILGRLTTADATLRQRVHDYAKQKLCDKSQANTDLTDLVKQKQEAEEHLDMILDCGPKARERAAEKARQLQSKIDGLDEIIRDLRARMWSFTEDDVPGVVDKVMSEFRSLGKHLMDADCHALRAIARQVLSSVMFNGLTREVTFNIVVPRRVLVAGASLLDQHWVSDLTPETKASDPVLTTSIPVAAYKFALPSDWSRGRVMTAVEPQKPLTQAA